MLPPAGAARALQPSVGMTTRLASAVWLLACASCATSLAPDDPVASDYDPVDWTSSDGKADTNVPAVFDRNNLMSDHIFTATDAVDGDAVQSFLESSPYGRSWLADETLEGMRFSDELVAVARERGLDPVLLLARLQVESSLVSATAKPHQSRIDIALGCGCPDASKCAPRYFGLANQLRCAGDILSEQFAGSQAGTGDWNAGKARTTSDGYRVTPRTNATAALYSYTPWVLPNHGGNWLHWNVMRRFLKAFDAAGTLHLQ